MRAIELFAGGGGLLLGCSLAGFRHDLAVEFDHDACETLRRNIAGHYPLLEGMSVVEGDVREVDWSSVPSGLDLLAGGPPCQPFSLGGLARAAEDSRDMFPAFTKALRDLRPRSFIVENVKGLTRSSFADYYSYILFRLEYPELVARPEESWREHLCRLSREHTSASWDGLRYRVVPTVVDAADYGVAQHRHRVFIVGFRSDVSADWSFPQATHSGASLRAEQESGAYWDRHEIPRGQRRTPRNNRGGDASLLPWRTVRDSLSQLPDPGEERAGDWSNHEFVDGARAYPGHTGSCLDEPSKAIKAGVHGVPGGENMMRLDHEGLRYYTAREAAHIQGFPDRYVLPQSWSTAMRQIGNAVPVRLAATVASSVANALELDDARTLIDYELQALKGEAMSSVPA